MSILRVARLGHPVLRRVADPIPPDAISDPEIQRLIDDMLETVEAYDGAGLAAPQVHVSLRLVVLQLDVETGMQVWINPVLEPQGDELLATFEGCLSVPGMRGAVARPTRVEVRALDRFGAPLHFLLEDFPAVVAQHECDHLDGVVYVDRVDPRTLAFVEELRRFGPFPWDGEDEDEEGALDDALTGDENSADEESS